MTATPTAPRTMKRLPVSRAPRIVLFALVFVLLAVLVFVTARYHGQRNGLNDARQQIEAETDITAGPDNLMQ
ncbi:MAG: hypothetical protein Q4E59_03485 [Bacteroidales bacterium]|nr:hypothetical protein [Bacteroidales bacterium]